MEELIVVSRNSPLSLLQVEEAFSLFPNISYQLLSLASMGDKDKVTPLTGDIPADFFTRELDELLLAGQADVGIHSAKDLPYPLAEGLEIYALLEACDRTDSLVSRDRLTLAGLPSGARVGTSSAARRAQLLACRPDVSVVDVRGNIGERIALVDAGKIDGLVVATCALKRLGLEARISETLPFATHPLQGHLAIVGRTGRPELRALFASKDVRRSYGKASLIGFGPGNPDLLTLKGDRLLGEATLIVYDDLLDCRFLDRYPGAKTYAGKRKDRHHLDQEAINEMLYAAAIRGEKVVRLKGGDPMIFAHGRDEIDYLRSRCVEVDVVPGISAGVAVASYAQIPLTHRGMASSVAFVSGHRGAGAQTPSADTLVYYMGGSHISAIARALIASGRKEETPAALVHNVTLPGQKVWRSTLGELQYSAFSYPRPILLIAGPTAAFAGGSDDERRKVLLTGTSPDGYAHDPNAVHTPLIRIDKIAGNQALLRDATDCAADWIVFTSRYGVRYFFDALLGCKADVRAFAGVRFASVGATTTAELNSHLICPDYESPTESAEGLIEYFREKTTPALRILLPRSDKGLPTLPRELEKMGHKVEAVTVYSNTVNEEAPKVDLAQFSKIVFSSPSGVEAFVKIYGEIPRETLLVGKGQTTEDKLKSYIYKQ